MREALSNADAAVDPNVVAARLSQKLRAQW